MVIIVSKERFTTADAGAPNTEISIVLSHSIDLLHQVQVNFGFIQEALKMVVFKTW